jgi:hypothetical protein
LAGYLEPQGIDPPEILLHGQKPLPALGLGSRIAAGLGSRISVGLGSRIAVGLGQGTEKQTAATKNTPANNFLFMMVFSRKNIFFSAKKHHPHSVVE